ncbi:M16 family metallopeptidase [Mariniradius sediminis]|uniref:Insulinase family protein n=1 Tax=Mariniradius sediminis TaxID=2909237 RepID=A0ABS9BZV9_9BACT|nr:pitrilysin family protein [Mariniradius sediminis]MCF1752809.1 insulinase family protein [Mariniradius sediminis]
MKKLIIYLFVVLLVQTSWAQVDRSTYPPAGPAREIKLGDAHSFTLPNGLKVFVVENRKLPRVAFSLVLDRDPIMEGDKAGMSGMVGEMLTGGTKNRSKDQLDEEVDFIGASLSASSTSIFGSALKKHQEKVLELMTDVLYNPTFPQAELDKLKKQAISGLAASKDDPNAISSRLASALNFGRNHPYGEVETEATIGNITVEDIKAYYNTYFKPNIAYLAIVGDINSREAEALVKKYFSKWEKGTVPNHQYAMPKLPEKNMVALVDRSASVQSVVEVTYPMEMSLSHPDYIATRLLNYILGGGSSSRLFMNLREKRGFTYGAYSSIGADKLVATFSAEASVKQVATDSAINEFIYEIRNLRDKGVDATELENAKATLSGSFGRSLESPSTIANFAINTERYKLPKDFYATYLQRLNALTVDDINAAAKKYLKPDNMYITVVGNGAVIEKSLAAFGEVSKFNNMGNPEVQVAMDANVTVDQVIEVYLNAIGGEQKASAIKTSRMESVAEIGTTKLNFVMAYDESNHAYANKVMVMGNVAMNTVIKNGKGTMTQMGQPSRDLNDQELDAMKMSMFIIPELHYEDMGYTLELDGIKDVEGDQAYKVIVKNPTGNSQVNYYSVSTGLKVKSENGEAGETYLSDYQEVEGVKFPMTMTIKSPMLPVPMAAKVEKLELNKPISEEEFK